MTSTFTRCVRMPFGLAASILLSFANSSIAANYQDTVLKLAPNYYYQLNETSTEGGAIDSTGNATPGTFNGDYANGAPMVGGPGPITVFNPDNFDGTPVPGVGGEENLAHYSNNEGHVTLGDGNLYGANSITVALFFKAGPAQGGDRLFTNNLSDNTKSFQVDVANDGLVLAVDPAGMGFTAERTLFMEDNSGPDRRLINSASGWFHVIASTTGADGPERAENFRLWINGVDRTANLQPNSTGWGVDTNMAKIGGRMLDPTHTTTHSGAQDEVAIWLDRVLTDEEAESLWEAAITEKEVPLVFNDVSLSEDDKTRSVTISWDSRPGKTYLVFATDSLADGEWDELNDSVASEGDTTSFTESSIPVDTRQRFYRVFEG